MSEPTIIYKTSLAVFKDKKMMMVREEKSADAFLTPGGKIEEGEDGIECLHREVLEELGTTIKEGSLKFLKQFEAPAYGRENTLVNIQLYAGELAGEATPSSEIVEIDYFDTKSDPKHLTPITIQIFEWLKGEGYID